MKETSGEAASDRKNIPSEGSVDSNTAYIFGGFFWSTEVWSRGSLLFPSLVLRRCDGTLNRIWRWSLGVTVKVKLTVVSMNREEQKAFESTAAPVRFCYPLKSQSVLTAGPLQPLLRRFACVSHRVGSLIAARVLFLYFPWWNSKFCRTTEGTG